MNFVVIQVVGNSEGTVINYADADLTCSVFVQVDKISG